MPKKDPELSGTRESTFSGAGQTGGSFGQEPGQSFDPGLGAGFAPGVNPYAQYQQQQQQQERPCCGLSYDAYDVGEDLVIVIPFPGLVRDTINIIQENRWLRICGETQVPGFAANNPNMHLIVSQNPKGLFDQIIQLPFFVQGKSAKATFTDGVVVITLKKALAEDACRVQVNFQ